MSDEDAQEVAQLKELFNSPAIPVGTYTKFEVSLERRMLADQAREEKEERDRLRREREEEFLRNAVEVRNKLNAGDEEFKAMNHEREEVVKAHGRAVREDKRAGRETIKELNQRYFEEARQRVVEASALDRKLDKVEAKADAKEREVATRERNELIEAIKMRREKDLDNKRAQAKTVRAETSGAVEQVTKAQHAARASEAEEVRKLRSGEWQTSRTQRTEAYVGKAKQKAEARERERKHAKALWDAAQKERKAAARAEKGNNHLVTEEKERILQANQKERAEVYKQGRVTITEDLANDFVAWRKLQSRNSKSVASARAKSAPSSPEVKVRSASKSRAGRSSR